MNNIDEAVTYVCGEVYPQDALSLLESIIVKDLAGQLVNALVSKERGVGHTEEDAVARVMKRLESLAESSPWIACALMAHLWPLASRLRMHEVWDSIALWISSCPDERLTSHLAAIVRGERDIDMRKQYNNLIQSRKQGDER